MRSRTLRAALGLVCLLGILPFPVSGSPMMGELHQAYRLLDAWDNTRAREMLDAYLVGRPGDQMALYLKALSLFNAGNYGGSLKILTEAGPAAGWPGGGEELVRLASDTIEATAGLTPYRSEHFILFVDSEKDWPLVEPGLEALEKGRREMGEFFGYYPEEPVRVEIYPSAESFQKASSLTIRDIEVSGAIGICKFNKIMLVSPRTLYRGYRWLDSLNHEYVHYLLVRLTANQAPIWVHEGTAKYFDRAWRGADLQELWPSGASLLAGALAGESRLVPFEDMDPSLVKLDTTEEVILAFAECATAIDFILSRAGPEGFLSFLARMEEMGRRRTREALQETVQLDFQQFESAWKDYVRGLDLQVVEHLNITGHKLAEGPEKERMLMAEIQATAGRNHLKLGDQLRMRGRFKPALVEYKRAYRESPGSVYIINKVAIAANFVEDYETARRYLEKAVKLAPDYPLTYLTAGNGWLSQGRFEEALDRYREYVEINPYNPEIYRLAGEAHYLAGRPREALLAWETSLKLNPNDLELAGKIENLKKE